MNFLIDLMEILKPMESKGIRILDKHNRVVSVKLLDILDMIPNGESFHWAILWSDITPRKGDGEFIMNLEQQVNKAENGLSIDWEELKSLTKKIHQEIDLAVIGCSNKENLHRFKNDREMYEQCDIVIEMFDTSYWRVFSKDDDLIERLGKKFKDVEFLSSENQSSKTYYRYKDN